VRVNLIAPGLVNVPIGSGLDLLGSGDLKKSSATVCKCRFFDQCPHLMTCAKCTFCRPQGSSRAQLLEAKGNLLRLTQEVLLPEQEIVAIDDGLEALERLCTQLNMATPAGPTPRNLASTASFIPLKSVDAAARSGAN
jgi:hypothetical protein